MARSHAMAASAERCPGLMRLLMWSDPPRVLAGSDGNARAVVVQHAASTLSVRESTSTPSSYPRRRSASERVEVSRFDLHVFVSLRARSTPVRLALNLP